MSKLRILHVIRTMNVGGAQTLIMNIYKKIDREKIQFDFLLNEKGVFDEEIQKLGGKVFYMPYITDVGHIKFGKKLGKFFKEHPEYKIIHSHMNQVSGFILEVAKKCDVPVRISHSHNIGNNNNLMFKIYKKYLQSKIPKNATHYLACSKEAAKWLFKDKKTEAIILNNGIELEKFAFSNEMRKKQREEFSIKEYTKVIGHVGRFSTQKNHLFLIEIFAEFHKKNKDSLLFLIGDGKLKEKCEQRVNELNLKKHVIFAGIRDNINELINIFDVFVLPSLYEGLGIVLIEAQANGLPCVASNMVPKAADVTGNVKFLSIDSPPKVWAEVIEKQCDLQHEQTIEKIREQGYDIMETVKKLEKIYKEALENKED